MNFENFKLGCSYEETTDCSTATKQFKLTIKKEVLADFLLMIAKNSLHTDKPDDGFRKTASAEDIPNEVAHNYLEQKSSKSTLKAREEITNDLVQQYISESIADMIGSDERTTQPFFEKESEDDSNVYFKIEVDTLEKISNFGFLDQLTTKTIKYEPNEEEIKEKAQKLLTEKYENEVLDCDKVAEIGDNLNVNFQGFLIIKGKCGPAFNGGTANDFAFKLGEGKMLPDFEKAFTGMKIGEEKAFRMFFPKDYGNQELAGVEVEFKIKLNKLFEMKEFGDVKTFLTKSMPSFSLEDKTSKEIQEKFDEIVQNALVVNVKKKIDTIEKERILDKINEFFHDMKLPNRFLQAEIKGIQNMYEEDLKNREKHNSECTDQAHDHSKDVKKLNHEEILAIAQTKVRVMIIFMNLIQHFNLSVESMELYTYLIEYAQNSGVNPMSVIQYYQSNKEALEQLNKIVLEEKVIKFIISKAQGEEQIMTTEEINAEYKEVLESEGIQDNEDSDMALAR